MVTNQTGKFQNDVPFKNVLLLFQLHLELRDLVSEVENIRLGEEKQEVRPRTSVLWFRCVVFIRCCKCLLEGRVIEL